MEKRYLYSLLFAVPGAFISLIIAFALFGATAGFLWLFVLSDNTWPSATDKILPLLLIGTFLVLWIGSMYFGFITGEKLESKPGLNKKHIVVSVGLTLAPILFIILHQLSVGNIGPKSNGQLCSDFCGQKGYSTSGMPPKNSGDRSCFCYDGSGNEILNVPIESILSSQ